MSGFETAVTTDNDTAPQFEQKLSPETQQPKAEAQTTPQMTSLEDGGMVINGRIYRPEDVAKKIEHADKHINTLEAENKEKDTAMIELLQRLEALEKDRQTSDAIDKIVEKVATQPAAPTQPIEPLPNTEAVSKEDLVEAAVNEMKQLEVNQQQEQNLNACVAKAQEVFGKDFGTKIDELSAKHGMTVDETITMAKNNPKVWNTLFINKDTPQGTPDVTGSSIGNVERTDFQEKRKSFMSMGAKERQAEVQRRLSALST